MKSLKNISGLILFVGLIGVYFSSCKKNDCKANQVFDCICTADYAPVCGCDGVTYSNACNADCVGIDVEHVGVCGQ